MKNWKVTRPSGIVAEIWKTAPDIYCKIIVDLMNDVKFEGKFPADWSDSIISSLFKGKGDLLDRSNYCGLKLTDHAQRVVENISGTINIDEMQFDFYLG